MLGSCMSANFELVRLEDLSTGKTCGCSYYGNFHAVASSTMEHANLHVSNGVLNRVEQTNISPGGKLLLVYPSHRPIFASFVRVHLSLRTDIRSLHCVHEICIFALFGPSQEPGKIYLLCLNAKHSFEQSLRGNQGDIAVHLYVLRLERHCHRSTPRSVGTLPCAFPLFLSHTWLPSHTYQFTRSSPLSRSWAASRTPCSA